MFENIQGQLQDAHSMQNAFGVQSLIAQQGWT